VYCQLGRTSQKTLERKEYVSGDEVLNELERKLAEGDRPDYISLAGSGEPTLHSGIGGLIRQVKSMTNFPVAVITNGSLLWISEVQEALMAADLVIPSLDAGDEQLFRYVNRPHPAITFEQLIEGLRGFTRHFPGKVWLEVFLLAGITGNPGEVQKIIAHIRQIQPARVQVNTVSRPPSESWALPLSHDQMLSLQALFPGGTEVISPRQGLPEDLSRETCCDDINLLGLLSRRPCTAADVADGLGLHLLEVLKRLDALLASGRVEAVSMSPNTFYLLAAEKPVLRS
jgi:pyruvate-formate lyase-activating enzyme